MGLQQVAIQSEASVGQDAILTKPLGLERRSGNTGGCDCNVSV